MRSSIVLEVSAAEKSFRSECHDRIRTGATPVLRPAALQRSEGVCAGRHVPFALINRRNIATRIRRERVSADMRASSSAAE